MYQAFVRFNQMFNIFQHHMQSNEVLAHTFFKGLAYSDCALLNTAAVVQNLSITSEAFFDFPN